ncbi:MAG: AbrB family transcriptional regulator [Spirochaetes bacterium]|nr:AbrB family transcriptional regulator [Spirochaetota bacterium]
MNAGWLYGTLFLFLLGTVGWKLFTRFHVPAPDMLGALFMASILAILGYELPFPSNPITLVSKLILGCYLGLMVDRTTLRELRRVLIPAGIVSSWMLILSLASGYVLYKVSHLSMETAFLGSTAGGIAEMAILGLAFHADTVTITILQLFRVLLFLIVMPLVARWNVYRAQVKHDFSSPNQLVMPTNSQDQSLKNHSTTSHVMLLLATLLGGFIGKALGIPAGDMLGAMFGVGTANTLVGDLPPVPPVLRNYARIAIGLAMAQQLTPETLERLSTLVLPIALLGLLMVASGILLSRILQRITGWDTGTCLLVSSPAGLTQMSIIAEEVGANPLVVSVLHTARLLSILTVLPFLFKLILLS